MKKSAVNDDIQLKNDKIGEILKPFRDRVRIFITVYCDTLDKTKAAVAAGYTQKSAQQKGWRLYHQPDINEAIQAYLRETAIKPSENVKLIRKIAETNLSDYFKTVKNVKWVRKKVHLKQLILDLKRTIELEEQYYLEAEGLTKLEHTEILENIRSWKKKMLKYQIELRSNPFATRFTDVEEVVEEAVFDLERAVKDRVNIQKIKNTDHGIQVEGYSSLDAQDKLARITGAYELDNVQTRPASAAPVVNIFSGVPPLATNETDVQ